MEKITKIFFWLVSTALGFIIFLPLINLIMLTLRTLKNLKIKDAGFFQFAFGFPTFVFIALSWPIFMIYCYHYYRDSQNIEQDFLKLITIEFYSFPALAIIYKIFFPGQLQTNSWIIAAGGLVIGTLTFLGYRKKAA